MTLPTEVAMIATHNMNSFINIEKVYDNNGDVVGSCNMRPLEEMFYIKGPMGRGLEMKHSGHHIAFCAGTGVLVFLDLVATLLMRNVYKAKALKEFAGYPFAKLNDDFEFHLYVAFQDADNAIGLDLCEALERVN